MGPDKDKVYRFALAIFYLGSAWALAYYTVTAVPQSDAVIKRLISGAAPLPHQYRVLGPWLISLLVKTGMFNLHRAELVFYVFAYLFASVALRHWLSLFLPKAAADLSPVWLFIAIINQLVFHYPCDALTLGFIPLLLYLAHERRWPWFIAVFALACFNNESTYLAIFALLALEAKNILKPRTNKLPALTLAASACVWLAVKAFLLHLYGDNTGSPVLWKLTENLRILIGESRPWDVESFPFLSSFGLPFVWLNLLAWCNFLWLLILPRWRSKSPALKRLGIVIAVQLLLLLFFANLWEKRVFLELVPLILPLALQTFFPPHTKSAEDATSSPAPSFERDKVLLAAVYIGLAWVMGYYTLASVPQCGADLVDCIMGRADLPFQYRILGPWVIYAFFKLGLQTLNQAELLFYVLAYLFAFASMRLWLSDFLPQKLADLSPVWVVALTVNQLIYRYPWDPLTLGFIPLLLHLAYRKNWTWFIVAFAAGTFNRETTYLALIAIFLFNPKETLSNLKKIVPPVAAAAIAWIAIKLILASLYFGNAGGVIEWSPPENLSVILGKSTSWDFFKYDHLHGFSVPLIWLSFLSWANFWWVLLLPKWRQKSPVLRRLGWLIIIQFLIIFFVGNIWERRVFLELYPIVIGLGLQTFFGRRKDEE